MDFVAKDKGVQTSTSNMGHRRLQLKKQRFVETECSRSAVEIFTYRYYRYDSRLWDWLTVILLRLSNSDKKMFTARKILNMTNREGSKFIFPFQRGTTGGSLRRWRRIVALLSLFVFLRWYRT